MIADVTNVQSVLNNSSEVESFQEEETPTYTRTQSITANTGTQLSFYIQLTMQCSKVPGEIIWQFAIDLTILSF